MLPFELTKDTPYLALSGELWSVFYEYFTEIDRVIKGFYCILTVIIMATAGGLVIQQPRALTTMILNNYSGIFCFQHHNLADIYVYVLQSCMLNEV